MKSDAVNHPAHYQVANDPEGHYECIKVLKAWLTPEEYRGFLKGNALKYKARSGKKSGNAVEDERKSEWYTAELIRTLEEQKP